MSDCWPYRSKVCVQELSTKSTSITVSWVVIQLHICNRLRLRTTSKGQFLDTLVKITGSIFLAGLTGCLSFQRALSPHKRLCNCLCIQPTSDDLRDCYDH